MQKRTAKLLFTRETVRTLDARTLPDARGGYPAFQFLGGDNTKRAAPADNTSTVKVVTMTPVHRIGG